MDKKKDTRIRSPLVTEDVKQFLRQNRFSVLRMQPEKANTILRSKTFKTAYRRLDLVKSAENDVPTPGAIRERQRIEYTENFKESVYKAWGQHIQGHTMYAIWRKLKLIELETSQMNREMSTLETKLNELKERLQHTQLELSANLFNKQLITIEKDTLIQLEKWITIYEKVLRQKLRETWLAYGDSNTKFFHAALKARQARNRMSSICTEHGIQDVTEAEVLQSLKDLLADKAPSIDGFLAEFFKQYWHLIGKEVKKATMQFFQTGKLLKKVNCTTVTLVPKVKNPTFVKEFRPRACCTTLYKLIAKVITARLKLVVDYLVGPSQSTFIKGRNILDNVIVAHEMVQCYTQKGVSPRCLVKVDIRRAYDSVKRGFDRMVLLEYGMPGKFVNVIMECVSTVSYSLLFNGGLTPRFQAKRGLRQGGPMFPCLFVLVMEYLNRSLKQLRHNPNFNYHPRCSKLDIVHICFADDLIMCCRADPISKKLMLQQLHHISAVSGLKENLEKSSFAFWATGAAPQKQPSSHRSGFGTAQLGLQMRSWPHISDLGEARSGAQKWPRMTCVVVASAWLFPHLRGRRSKKLGAEAKVGQWGSSVGAIRFPLLRGRRCG
nr:uncharacterized protein LOC104105365 [Nicotiana tomentosiformis]